MLAFESILAWIVIGAIAGWLAGLIVEGYGFGLIGNIVVGNRGRWHRWLAGTTAWPVHGLDRRKYHCRNARRGHSTRADRLGQADLAATRLTGRRFVGSAPSAGATFVHTL